MDSQAELLHYFERELSYLRQMGTAFAERYPKVAARLRLGPEESDDPHVERLLESFAFLSGRLHRDIEKEFPEITQALLGVLYPQLVAPVPAMAIARFDLIGGEGKITSGYPLPAGTPLIAESKEGHQCRFRTGSPLTLWPFSLKEASFEVPARFPFLEHRPGIGGVMRLRLCGTAETMAELELDHLRLYVNGDGSTVAKLIDLFLTQVSDVVLLPDGDMSRPIWLGKQVVEQVGFADEEALLPYPDSAHKGYRLLQEYFCFPHKFRFFDIHHLFRAPQCDELEILLCLDRPPRGWQVRSENLLTGCAPVINLFNKVSDPIRVDHRQHRYRLFGDSGRQRMTEIHTIRKVTSSPKGSADASEVTPFFSCKHHHRQSGSFWIAHRQPCMQEDMPGTEVSLAFVDLDRFECLPEPKTVYAHTLCTNRRLATQLPSGALLQIDRPSALAQVRLVTNPTPPVMSALGSRTHWKLISHLSLNYLSLSEGSRSLEALKEMMTLYIADFNPGQERQIRGITAMNCRRKMQHLGDDAWRGFCRGLEITLDFDERFYAGGSPLLLASVLQRFFALYATVNSFTQLVVRRVGRKGEWHRWPPMAGEQFLV